ncbi:MAG: 3'-5' exonuclease [Endomicrobiales bacterium]|nr:3'-5' exonuclease [Endomicrobiales bacterium]
MKYNPINENIVEMDSSSNVSSLSFLDVETTGLSVSCNDRICEIAIMRYSNSGEKTFWQSLVNPQRPISSEASRVNKISDDMVKDAPVFDGVKDRVLELINDSVIVCHNAPFDLSFITYEFEKCGVTIKDLQIIDTLKIARQYFNFPYNSLGSIANLIGIQTKNKHRALPDVLMTFQIFNYFLVELSKDGIGIEKLIMPYTSR